MPLSCSKLSVLRPFRFNCVKQACHARVIFGHEAQNQELRPGRSQTAGVPKSQLINLILLVSVVAIWHPFENDDDDLGEYGQVVIP